MRVVTFNAWQGQDDRSLYANLWELLMDTGMPEVLATQEVSGFGRSFPGYARIGLDADGPREHSSAALFVRRKGVRILRARILRVGGPTWRGPNGLVHEPRVYPAVSLLVGRERWRVLDVHRAPLRHINDAAWRAEDLAISRYAGPPELRRPLVMAGDWNAPPKVLDSLASRTGTNLRVLGIDGALTRNCDGTAHKLPDTYGSDAHRPVVLDLTKEKAA